jgi:thiamine biosynthesis protein ThiS
MKEIVVENLKTIPEILDELQLSSIQVLVGVNGQLLNPDEIKGRKLKKGDKVSIIQV